jgi:hypothetical protein
MSDRFQISPVVGVILMLAAVIAALVFGMAANQISYEGGKHLAWFDQNTTNLPTPTIATPVPPIRIHRDLMAWTDCEDRIVCFGATGYGVSCFFNETSLLEKYCPEA